MSRRSGNAGLLCPSARPDTPGATIFGVVDRSGGPERPPEVRYLADPVPLTGREVALLGAVPPGAVFRLGARCAESGCRHFTGSQCSLGERLVQLGPTPPPETVDEVPPCALRPGCRWFRERGVEVCRRCRWVVSEDAGLGGSEALRRRVATPGPNPAAADVAAGPAEAGARPATTGLFGTVGTFVP